MLKETIKYARDVLGKDKPLKITLDNQHIFYDRLPMSCPLMWDDENERIYILRTNQDAMSQVNLPLETTVVDYEDIQQVAVYDDLATVQSNEWITLLTEDQKKKFIEFLGYNGTRGMKPNTYFKVKAKEDENEEGKK